MVCRACGVVRAWLTPPHPRSIPPKKFPSLQLSRDWLRLTHSPRPPSPAPTPPDPDLRAAAAAAAAVAGV